MIDPLLDQVLSNPALRVSGLSGVAALFWLFLLQRRMDKSEEASDQKLMKCDTRHMNDMKALESRMGSSITREMDSLKDAMSRQDEKLNIIIERLIK